MQSKKKEGEEFLRDLKGFIGRKDFDIKRDFKVIAKPKPNDLQYSTPHTVIALDYDDSDVLRRINELTVEEYSETKIDNGDAHPPLLFVFGKVINGKLVYIKLKIREREKGRYILCVSFHFAREKMNFPYANEK